ncbi:MAG TPA: sodium-dependent transporter [Acidobacteriota bacterium]|nr:sodium-dependent transporter [Acidobacteriota bacterium]
MDGGLNTWGWCFLTAGWGSIFALTAFCVIRLIRARRRQPETAAGPQRDYWATRIGMILAMAGNAIGLGNFLRFPVQAASNGGGAYLIPYFCAFLLLGIPMMWMEWAIGRMGGQHGHGSTPGMFALLWRRPAAKYLGALGVFLPLVVVVYYNVIESWTLAYTWFSATGRYFGHASREAMGQFLRGFQGAESNAFFQSPATLIIFLAITLGINFIFLYRGISRGIEVLAKYGMPLLFVFAVLLAIRVLFLGTPDPAHPECNVVSGLGFMWNPDFSRLGDASVWLAAAGQIFFTTGISMGIMTTYASYIRRDADLTLNGLSTATTNEFVEIILGGTIAIPAAVAFFGLVETQEIARQGAYDLGFQALPVIFQQLPLGELFGAVWFLLLFIAGITSSAALTQPAIALLQDDLGWSRRRAVLVVFGVLFVSAALVVLYFRYGFLDELDFWAGTFGLVVLGASESILFSWVYGIRRGWEEITRGAELRIPQVFRFVMKYITPVYLLIILGVWLVQDAVPKLLMQNVPTERQPYLWGARALLFVIALLTLAVIRVAWSRRARRETERTASR